MRRRIQGKVDVADVVQETFLEAQPRPRTVSAALPEGQFLAWLRQILRGDPGQSDSGITWERSAGTSGWECEPQDDLDRCRHVRTPT